MGFCTSLLELFAVSKASPKEQDNPNDAFVSVVSPVDRQMERNADQPEHSHVHSLHSDADEAVMDLEATSHLFPQLVRHRLDPREVLMTRKLCHGDFSIVWLGLYHGQPVAVKSMVNGSLDAEPFATKIMTMAKLNHPRIVEFIGAFWTNAVDLSSVTEYMDGGDLRSLLDNRKVQLSWPNEKISIAIDIAESLCYLQSLTPSTVNRDLASRDVLLTKKLVAKLSRIENRVYEENAVSLRWTALEVMRGEDYSELTDIYSFGVIMSELDTRELPYKNKSNNWDSDEPEVALVMRIIKGELRPMFNDDCPPSILHIAKSCLESDPWLRPSASKLVELLNEAKIQLQRT